jgi:hypothetical protein
MEHPTYEQLLSYIEASPAGDDKKIREHLENCPECAAELAGWQRTIQKLQNTDWPKEEARPPFSGAVLKWAAAATILILGIGFGLGRASEPSAERLKQTIITQVTRQVRNDLKADLLAAVATSNSGITDAFRQQFRRELVSILNNTVDQRMSEQKLMVQETLRAAEQRQDEKQRMLVALLNQVRREHESDYLSLRHDLETAASVADNDLRQNQQRLSQLASTVLAKDHN